MILSRLEVKKLYGRYDYDISFNRDITLIYGLNGCGKTTLLNMVTALITGSIYKLFPYNFEEIDLHYVDDNLEEPSNSEIDVKRNENKLLVRFNGLEQEVVEQIVPDEHRRRRSMDSIYDYYAELYPFLKDIKHEFNYVYLALNRTSWLSEESEDIFFRRNIFYNDGGIVEPAIVPTEIRIVESLIMNKKIKASSEINKINNEFRNKVLKKSTNFDTYDSDKELLNKIRTFTEKEINEISMSYLKILDGFGLVNEKEKNRYDEFFKNCIENGNSIKGSTESSKLISFIIQCYNLTRIQEIVKMAEDAEKRKDDANKPLNLFLDTVNEFVGHSNIEKRINIDENGRVFFYSEEDERKLSIQFLSSGEKQLLVFFANLIFGVNTNKTGIFVVDEPELSLHLSWQKVFIDKALEVNKNVQFIFATHSPEIIGKHRDKMKKLERKNTR